MSLWGVMGVSFGDVQVLGDSKSAKSFLSSKNPPNSREKLTHTAQKCVRCGSRSDVKDVCPSVCHTPVVLVVDIITTNARDRTKLHKAAGQLRATETDTSKRG